MIYIQLNGSKYFYQIKITFKQIHLTHILDTNMYYHSRLEWTRDFTLPRAQKLEPHHQMLFSVIPRIHLLVMLLYIGNEETTLLYKNIISFLFFFITKCMEELGQGESQEQLRYRGRYRILREPLLVQGQLKTSNHLKFGFFAKHPFFLLGSNQFLTFLHTSHYLKAFNHFSFCVFNYRAFARYSFFFGSYLLSTLASLVQIRPFSTSQSWAVWNKASTQGSVRFNDSSAGPLFSLPGLKIFSHNIAQSAGL